MLTIDLLQKVVVAGHKNRWFGKMNFWRWCENSATLQVDSGEKSGWQSKISPAENKIRSLEEQDYVRIFVASVLMKI